MQTIYEKINLFLKNNFYLIYINFVVFLNKVRNEDIIAGPLNCDKFAYLLRGSLSHKPPKTIENNEVSRELKSRID